MVEESGRGLFCCTRCAVPRLLRHCNYVAIMPHRAKFATKPSIARYIDHIKIHQFCQLRFMRARDYMDIYNHVNIFLYIIDENICCMFHQLCYIEYMIDRND